MLRVLLNIIFQSGDWAVYGISCLAEDWLGDLLSVRKDAL